MAAECPPRGQLHIFVGAATAVGKSYAMLAEGKRLAASGADVVVALVETHGRRGLEQAATGCAATPTRCTPTRNSLRLRASRVPSCTDCAPMGSRARRWLTPASAAM